MTYRNSILDWFLYAVVIFCIFSFKFTLGGMKEAGARVDDILIVLALVVLVLRRDLFRIKPSTPFKYYLAFVSAGLVSALWNGAVGRVNLVYSLLFVLRLVEYMVFYFLGFRLARCGFRLSRPLTAYVVALAVVIPLQMVGIIPVPGSLTAARATGNTNGPYELAVVAAFLLCYLGFEQRKRLNGALSVVFIALTASRITSAATFLTLFKAYFRRSRPRTWSTIVIAMFTVVAVSLGGGWLWISGTHAGSESAESYTITNRLSGMNPHVLGEAAVAVYKVIPTYNTSEEYIQGQFLSATGDSVQLGEEDVSSFIRVFRWTSLVRSTLAHVDSCIIGLGPSFGSAAVDGYYVRVFIETGIVGLILFFRFAKALLGDQNSGLWSFREYVFILLITACFIDIFTSYKAMILLWLWHGMNQYRVAEGADANRLELR
jgi:hypothetical protein